MAKKSSQKDKRINQILEMIYSLAAGDLDLKNHISEKNDDIDAIMTGMNMLAEELKYTTVSKDYVDNIMSSMFNSLVVVNSQDKIITVNPATCEMLGYSKEELLNKKASLIFGRSKIYKKVLKNKDINYIAKNKKKIPVLLSSASLTGNSENESGYVCIANNISDLKQVQDEEKKTFSIVKATLESTYDGILVVGNDGKVMRANEQFQLMWGIPDEVYHSKDDSKMLDCVLSKLQDPEGFLKKVKELYESDKRDLDYINFKDGRVFERYSCPLVNEDKIEGRVWNFRDITDKVRSEERILEYTNYLNTLFSVLPVGIFIVDPQSHEILDINDYASGIFGEEKQKIIGKKCSNYICNMNMNNCPMTTGSKVDLSENKILNEAGVEIPVLKSVVPITRYGKKVYLETFIDIAVQKETQYKLEKTLVELENSNKELAEYSYIMAHHLQEPLRLIASYLQLIEWEYSSYLDTKAHEYINFAVDGSKTLKNLINGFLDYNLLNRKEISIEKVDLNEALTAAMKNIEDMDGYEKAEIVVGKDLPDVLGNFNQISHVLKILLKNAIEYRSDRKPVISIDFKENCENYIVSVKDNGKGIDSDIKDKVFNIFTRLEGHITHKNTGVGLTMAKRIMKKIKGGITFESDEGKGSTFYLSFKKSVL